MKQKVNEYQNIYPIIFLGISEHLRTEGPIPPITPIDIYKLKKISTHIIYPIPLKSFYWMFLINSEYVRKNLNKEIRIELKSEYDDLVAFFSLIASLEGNISPLQDDNVAIIKKTENKGYSFPLPKEPTWFIQTFNVDASINKPGIYNLYAGIHEASNFIDQIEFKYQRISPYTSEQIKAIESDPSTSKVVLLEIGCKYCPKRLKTYTALDRDVQKEKEGYIWQFDLPHEFICTCKKTKQNLVYLKESMHGLLGKPVYLYDERISYERRHSHYGILKILNKYSNLLKNEQNEEVFQNFIKKYPIMLAKYHSKKIFFKKDILGEFVSDIIILDTEGYLLFIELERPDLYLFKKNGHPTAKLTHAYGQVVDWINKFKNHPHAVLDKLKLKAEDVSAVKGVVIAGKSGDVNPEHLRRHNANPIYTNIEFLTYDNLADSLAQISRDLI